MLLHNLYLALAPVVAAEECSHQAIQPNELGKLLRAKDLIISLNTFLLHRNTSRQCQLKNFVHLF